MHLNMRRSFDPIRIPGIAIDEDESREADPGYPVSGYPGPGQPGSDYRDQDPYNLKTTYEFDPLSTYPNPRQQPPPRTLQEASPLSRYESQTDLLSTYPKPQPQPRPPIIQEESPLSVSLPVSGAEKVRLPVENKTVPIPVKAAVPASLESSIADLADIMQVIKHTLLVIICIRTSHTH